MELKLEKQGEMNRKLKVGDILLDKECREVEILAIDEELDFPIIGKVPSCCGEYPFIRTYEMDGRFCHSGESKYDLDINYDERFEVGNIIQNNYRTLLVLGEGLAEDEFKAVVLECSIISEVGEISSSFIMDIENHVEFETPYKVINIR